MIWFLLLLLLVIITIVFLSLIVAIQINFVFSSSREDLHITLQWFEPLIKVIIRIEELKPKYEIFLFNRSIYSKKLISSKKKSRLNVKNSVSTLEDIKIDAEYGFSDPYETGIAFGAINMIEGLPNVASIKQHPNYMVSESYINVNGTAKIHIGSALAQILRN